MFMTQRMRLASVTPEFKAAMRAQILRLSLHFLAGFVLAMFLLPEGVAIVLAAAVAATGVKALYDYLDRGVNVPACICVLLGAMAALLTAV
jgi:predicted PurR-regulated permease PerM